MGSNPIHELSGDHFELKAHRCSDDLFIAECIGECSREDEERACDDRGEEEGGEELGVDGVGRRGREGEGRDV